MSNQLETAQASSIAANNVKQQSTVIAGAKPVPLLITILLASVLWFCPVPMGLTAEAWHLFAIFIGVIAGLILRPMANVPVVLTGSLVALLTKSIPITVLLGGFSQSTIWLIVFSFFLARALINTGLATRGAYMLMAWIGRSTLGMSYAVIFSEFLISPFVPSLSARSGGIIFPLALSLASHHAGDGPEKSNTSKFLLMSIVQGSVICSTLFLTSMAGNPMSANMAGELGITITWSSWAIAACVPGLLSLLVTPWIISKLLPPETLVIPEARKTAQDKLAAMGPMSSAEWLMLTVFIVVLALWIIGPTIGVDSTTAILLGIIILFLTGVLSWKDCMKEESAWDTFVSLSILVSLGVHLKAVGFFDWISANMQLLLGDFSWQIGFAVLLLVYFYVRYLFASSVAHITAMYLAFLVASQEIGTPPMIAAVVLGFFGALSGGLTHYASAPAAIFFGTGYLSLQEWWKVSGIVSIINVAIWLGVGAIWWKVLGLW